MQTWPSSRRWFHPSSSNGLFAYRCARRSRGASRRRPRRPSLREPLRRYPLLTTFPSLLCGCTLCDMLLSRRPGPPLNRFVECIWHHVGQDGAARGRERASPNGRFQLVLNLRSETAAVSGLRSSFVVVDTAAV